MIIAGKLIGLFQIFHFLHFFSVLTAIKYIDKFYNYISDNKFLEKFFKVNFEDIEDITDDNDKNNKNLNEIDDSSLFESIIDSLQLKISGILGK